MTKRFGGGRHPVTAVRDVSFEVPHGCFFTLLGPSGCGKTTVLRCIAGLEQPEAGEIRIGGRLVFSARSGVEVPTERRPIGMVFQSYAIWPHMTVFGNAAYTLRYGRRPLPAKEVAVRVHQMLQRIGLASLADRWATQLSGGQQQRLALARALLGDPQLLLLDEPLSNLDANLRATLRSELKGFQRIVGVTTLYVTHDQAEALSLSDRIAVLRDGVVEQIGAPQEIYAAPANAFVATFLGNANLLHGTCRPAAGLLMVDCEAGELFCDGSAPAGTAVAVSIRAEDIELWPAEDGAVDSLASSWTRGGERAEGAPANTFFGRIRALEFLGDRLECRVEVGSSVLRAYAWPGAVLHPGDRVRLRVGADRCRVLGETGGPAAAAATAPVTVTK